MRANIRSKSNTFILPEKDPEYGIPHKNEKSHVKNINND